MAVGVLLGYLSLSGGAAYYLLPALLALIAGVLFVALARLMDLLWGIKWALEEKAKASQTE